MSVKIRDLVTDRSLARRPAELLVLQQIADYANDDGTGAWPSQERLAAQCRIGVRYLGHLIKAAEERGELTVRYRGHGLYGTNEYTIVVEQLAKQPSVSERVKVQRAARRATPTERRGRRESSKANHVTNGEATEMHEAGYPQVHEAEFAQWTSPGSSSDGTVVPAMAEPEYLRSIIEPEHDPSVDPSGHRSTKSSMGDHIEGIPYGDDVEGLSSREAGRPHRSQDLQVSDLSVEYRQVPVQASVPVPRVTADYPVLVDSRRFLELAELITDPERLVVAQKAIKTSGYFAHKLGDRATQSRIQYIEYIDRLFVESAYTTATEFFEIFKPAYDRVRGTCVRQRSVDVCLGVIPRLIQDELDRADAAEEGRQL